MSYPTSNQKELFKAILELKNDKEAAAFLRDLLTISEIEAASERWQMAKLLWTTSLSYKKIAKKTSGSTTTVTRVAHWIENGMGGYKTILTRLFGSRRKSNPSS